ncbi:MAG: Pls/PosA family non-ribosomal peptide synthetase [Roseiarcus sp.]
MYAKTLFEAAVPRGADPLPTFERAAALHGSAALRRAAPPAPLSILEDASPPRWRHGERFDDVLAQACRRFADRPAIAVDGAGISYREFDARANQMARFFISRGVRPGDRVGALLDRGLEAYVALYALLKAGAAYVALDANHPADRVAYILSDSAVSLALAHSRLADRFEGAGVEIAILDEARERIAECDASPLADDERGDAGDELAYVLYTSGTTGHPKGVAIEHRSLANFARVAAESYGFGPGERVYQGMSIAFDFSIEEFWVPLVAGATIVPNTAAASLFGEELADFLESREVTAFCCVPTLLASIERELPKLKILLIGGEACPASLVKRWSRPGRTLLNSYGPTETTVTATLGHLRPDKPVTIGRPLPTYSIVILDPERDAALPQGEAGEIGIGGVGVARGYLNRPELTAAKFIADFIGLPNNPSRRIYRTGDLGRIGRNGEIEYLGRIDTQVKLRGYRIELTEIESALMETPEIAQCVVSTFEPTQGTRELVAYYSVKHGASAPEARILVRRLRAKLPAYMVPAYLERLPFMPMLISNKPDRARLPAPKSARLAFAADVAPPTTATETLLCKAFSDTMGLAEVSVDGDFFNEYGAHSLLMARFCARIRALSPAVNVAMRDVYANPTIRRLARALDSLPTTPAPVADATPVHRPSRAAYLACGAAQSAAYVLLAAAALGFVQLSLVFTYAGLASPLELFARAILVALVWFFGHNALAVAAKWALVGRVEPQAIALWSAAYFRYWLARLIVLSAPANAFVGAPLFNVFLRLLGARIGRNAIVASLHVPLVSADLISVGDNAVITRTAMLGGANAYGNRLHLDAIHIGAGSYVGERSVIDIGAAIGDFGQLGHASSLQRGQRVPAGKRYHGSPAEETTTNFRLGGEIAANPVRRILYSIGQLLGALVLGAALVDALATAAIGLWAHYLQPTGGFGEGEVSLVGATLAASLAAYLGAMALGLAIVYVVPRLANRFLAPGRLYPLYGFHYAMQQIVAGVSNNAFFNLLFGDSIFIERYLGFIGWRLGEGDMPGSNFGADQAHDNPFLCSIGAGTVASDGLFLGNYQMSSRAFRVSPCRVGKHNFFGTDVYVPPGARAGDNVMYASKAMAPIDGPLRENVGLLGSPAFEIPRASARDAERLGGISAAERSRRLALKTRHNVATMAMFLGAHWFVEFFALYALTTAAYEFGATSYAGMAAAVALVALVALTTYVLVERASIGFRRLAPGVFTVYDPAFWRIERYWKLSDNVTTTLFAGTPMRNVLSRWLGVTVGRMVFDDGCVQTERSLIEIDDEANLNADALIQPHSLEDGVFKSDRVRIGAGSAIAPGALVHYGVTMREHTRLDADSFLMKGEITPPHSHWRGNPAKLVHVPTAGA